MEAGREVQELWWTGKDGDALLRPPEGHRLVLINEFHGSYDLDWIVLMKGDKEISRHNTLFIASIVWKIEGEQ
jgi:hypothetical protein